MDDRKSYCISSGSGNGVQGRDRMDAAGIYRITHVLQKKMQRCT